MVRSHAARFRASEKAMTDQKQSSPDQKDHSPLTADQRRRMREAAEAAARLAPGEWRTGDDGPPFYQGFYAVTCDVFRDGGPERRILLQHNARFPVEPQARFAVEAQPSAVLALLDALEQTERERDALRERLAAVAVPEALPSKTLEWADVCRLQDEVDALNARGADRGELERAETSLRIAKTVWGLEEHERARR